MTNQTTERRSLMGRWFPTRYVYLRDGDDVRAWALTPARQFFGALAAVLVGGWFLVASGGFAFDLVMQSQADRTVARARAASERLNADLQARLDSAVVRMTATTGSLDEMAQMVERRHAALTQVMGMFRGVDEPFAVRIRNAADNLSDMRGLADAAESMPFHRPTSGQNTSGFGVRFDPFNRRPALHQGQDFAGALNTPVRATAPGIVSFVGVRSGYGNTVEIDHGRGFKTRYAHLNSMAVRAGQRIALGQRLGAMGTTGRSTGVHLHYEVWMNGRPQNPARFLRAGDQLVQQD